MQHLKMNIAGDFISSVLFTADSNNNNDNTNNNNSNSSNNNVNNNTYSPDNSHNHDSGNSNIINNGNIVDTDMQQLHLLGLHFDDLDDVTCDPISLQQCDNKNNNSFGYQNGDSGFVRISPNFITNPNYDEKSHISWPADNTDGAIYSFEIINDTATHSPFWEEDNLSPITVKHQQYSDEQVTLVSEICGDSSITDATGNSNNDGLIKREPEDQDSTNLLLRNALLGKTTARYSDKEPVQKSIFATSKPEDRLLIIPSLDLADNSEVACESNELNLFDPQSSLTIASASSPQIHEMFLPGFESFSYTEEQLARINQDLAQTIQQICNTDDQNYVSYIPTQDVEESLQIDNQIPLKNTKRSKKSSSKLKTSVDTDNHVGSTNAISMGGDLSHTVNGNCSSTAGGGGAIRKERSLHHCFVCNKGFKDKYSVNVHIRTHTGEKPFSCMVCGKRFRQKAHLAKHQHTHFQKKTLPPSSPTAILNPAHISPVNSTSPNIDHSV